MFNGIVALGKAKTYTDDSLVGVGALKGKPCTVKSYRIDAGTNNTIITFAWIDDAGVEHTQEVTVKKGVDGEDGAPGADGADGAPGINGVDGEDGITPTLVIDPVTYHWIINDVDTGVVAKGTKGDKGDHGDNYTKTSELVNDSGFITNTVNNLLSYYTKAQVDDIIANLEGVKFEIVTELPSTPEANTIYLMESAPGSGVYVEYIYASGSWRPIGSTDVDLSNYYTKSQTFSREQVQALLNSYATTANTYTKAQVDAALYNKADNNNVYTRNDIDVALGYKADVATTYNKTQVNNLVSDKADKTEVYTKTQIVSLLNDKADVATTYTKTEVDGKLDDKADKLPTIVRNRYLHTNDTTGDLEWTEVNDADIKVKENGGILNDEEDGLSIDCGTGHTIQFGVTSSGKAGYKLDGADSVTPFRNPQGNATSADVLYGKVFANASSDYATGTLPDLSGEKVTGLPYYDDTTNDIGMKPLSEGVINGYTTIRATGSSFGSATTDKVLSNATFTSANGLKLTGTMSDYSASDKSATADFDSTNVRIRLKVPSSGYYSSSHYLYSAASNFGNVTAANVLSGNTFTSTAGLKQTGTMTNCSANDYSATASFDSTNARVRLQIPNTGYYSNSHYLYSDVSNFGNAYLTQVLEGATFTSVVGLKKTGSMKNYSSSDYSATASFDSTNARIKLKIPSTGYYSQSYYLYSDASDFGTVTADKVLYQQTFTSTAGLKKTGTMSNYSTDDYFAASVGFDSTNTRVRFKLPGTGYYSGDHYLHATGSTFGNATAADVLNGKTFTSTAGLKVTGTAVAPTPSWSQKGVQGGASSMSRFTLPIDMGFYGTIKAGEMWIIGCLSTSDTAPEVQVTTTSGVTEQASTIGYTSFDCSMNGKKVYYHVKLIKWTDALVVGEGTINATIVGSAIYGAMASKLI